MDSYIWLVEQEQDLLYLVEQAYGSNEMATTTYGSTIIPVSETYQIEIMPSGNHYPMHKWEDGDFYYFRKGRNGQTSFKSERGARKFIEEYAARVDGK